MKKASKRKVDEDMLPEYDFSKAVRGRYAGKFNRESKITIRDSSGRIVKVTTVGEAISPHWAPSSRPARSAAKARKRNRIQKSRSAD